MLPPLNPAVTQLPNLLSSHQFSLHCNLSLIHPVNRQFDPPVDPLFNPLVVLLNFLLANHLHSHHDSHLGCRLLSPPSSLALAHLHNQLSNPQANRLLNQTLDQLYSLALNRRLNRPFNHFLYHQANHRSNPSLSRQSNHFADLPANRQNSLIRILPPDPPYHPLCTLQISQLMSQLRNRQISRVIFLVCNLAFNPPRILLCIGTRPYNQVLYQAGSRQDYQQTNPQHNLPFHLQVYPQLHTQRHSHRVDHPCNHRQLLQ